VLSCFAKTQREFRHRHGQRFSHHSVRLEKCLTTNWIKPEIIEWLQSNGEVVDSTMVITELLDEVDRIKPKYNKHVNDEMVKANKKIVLILHPYILTPLNLHGLSCNEHEISPIILMTRNHVTPPEQ